MPTLVAQAGKGDAAAVLEQAVAADDSAALEERQRIVKAAVGPGGDPEDLLRRIRARFDRRARARRACLLWVQGRCPCRWRAVLKHAHACALSRVPALSALGGLAVCGLLHEHCSHCSLSIRHIKRNCGGLPWVRGNSVGHAVSMREPVLEQCTSCAPCACCARRRKQADAGACCCRVGMELPTVEVRFENVQARHILVPATLCAVL